MYCSRVSGLSYIVAAGLRFACLRNASGDVGEVVARRAVLVHVAPGRASRSRRPAAASPTARLHWSRGPPSRCAERPGPRPAAPSPPRLRARQATATSHWPVATAIAAWPTDAAAGAAAVADLGEEGDVAEADVAGDLDLAVGLHRVRREPVDLGGLDAGVVERREHGLSASSVFVGQPLGERRLADADDRGLISQHVAFLGSPASWRPHPTELSCRDVPTRSRSRRYPCDRRRSIPAGGGAVSHCSEP